jgi:hypothetical protein
VGKSQLADPAQTLEPGMLNQVKYYSVGNRNKTVDRIVKYFLLVQGDKILLCKYRNPAQAIVTAYLCNVNSAILNRNYG